MESVPLSAQTLVYHSPVRSAIEVNSIMACLLLSQELSHHTRLHPPRSMQ